MTVQVGFLFLCGWVITHVASEGFLPPPPPPPATNEPTHSPTPHTNDPCGCSLNYLDCSNQECVCNDLAAEDCTCDYDACCLRRRVRRMLAADQTFLQGNADVVVAKEQTSLLLESCVSYDYESYLFVDTHLYGLAIPASAEAIQAGCPFLAIHANFLSHTGHVQKQLLVWRSVTEGQLQFPSEYQYPMGVFPLHVLLEAFEQTPLPQQSKIYDIVSNNCALYLVQLAKRLNITIDRHVAGFVAARLWQENGDSLLQAIRSSVNYQSYFGGTSVEKKDSELVVVEELVHVHAKELFE